mmetsp:Transcript_58446/g.117354  ORF Transcript_58446/g.117354 Transcript_58446/m.117354 type:complete len:81 (-) Transcript_58446:7-249(-)
MRRCEAEQSRQMNTPNGKEAQVGFRAGQSKHVLFSVFALSLLNLDARSPASTYLDILNWISQSDRSQRRLFHLLSLSLFG